MMMEHEDKTRLTPEALPPVGASIELVFEDCCVAGTVYGEVAEATFEEGTWPPGHVKFTNGSTVDGASHWRVKT